MPPGAPPHMGLEKMMKKILLAAAFLALAQNTVRAADPAGTWTEVSSGVSVEMTACQAGRTPAIYLQISSRTLTALSGPILSGIQAYATTIDKEPSWRVRLKVQTETGLFDRDGIPMLYRVECM